MVKIVDFKQKFYTKAEVYTQRMESWPDSMIKLNRKLIHLVQIKESTARVQVH